MLESFRFIEYFKDGNPIQMKKRSAECILSQFTRT